jgi:methylthioribulose-1-phosphate dehydratase
MIGATSLAEGRRLIAEASRDLAGAGFAPATSGNFSMRVGPTRAAITASGLDKATLSETEVIEIDLRGRATSGEGRPSAETTLHTQLYRRSPEVGAVLHTHSRVQTVASRVLPTEGRIVLAGYELLKALTGITTHDTSLVVPVFPNTQELEVLARQVEAWLDAGHVTYGYLIDGHGMYTWARDMPEARRHLEALDFLLACELSARGFAP